MEMAAVGMLAPVVSPIINSLVSKAASYFGGDITPKEVRKLKNIILPKIQTVIEMAEDIPADKLKPWLIDLRASALEAEDVLDSCEYKNIENKVSGRPKTLDKWKVKSKFAAVLPKTTLKKSMEKLQESAQEADELRKLIKTRMADSPREAKGQQSSTTVSRLPSPVFGRDEECNDLIKMLINEPSNDSSGSGTSIPVLAVQGIGGAGKTTVAQCIYGDTRVERHFDTRMWVHVSRKFDVHRVTREIIESASQGSDKCSDISNLNTLQMKLEELLKSKRFLLILDDIWCEDRGEWDKLLTPLNKSGKMGSRILITNRMEGVALQLGVQSKNIRSLKDLRSEDCWSILKYYAFGDDNKAIEDKKLATAGKKIVDKLKNSPLAARLVGSLFGRNVDADAWDKFLKKGVLGGTLDHLLLSFRHLPLHLQSCFAFCSLYPKGYSFSKDELSRLWVAEGFVEASTEDGLTAVEKGQQYFDELLSCSFFQPELACPYEYIIHDLLHDLAEEVSKGHSFRIEGEPPANIPPTVVRLSVVGGLPASSLDAWELVNLRTFMHIVFERDDHPQDIITEDVLETLAKYKTLRVLHLQSSVNKLPGPKRGLRVLEIGRLTLLQTLSFYHVERSKGYGIEQLKNLQQLRGSLTIDGLEIVKNKADAIEARLKQKEHLEELTLVWKKETNRDGMADEEVLEGLEPPQNLGKLEIIGYMGANTRGWMRNNQYLGSPHPYRLSIPLKRLYISFCENLSSLPENLEELSSLEILEISGCPKMESMPNLPASLKQLNINLCGNLLSLSENIEELSSLERLHILGCPKMESLPNMPTSLKELYIFLCDPQLAEKYGEGGPLRHEINHIPSITIPVEGRLTPRDSTHDVDPGYLLRTRDYDRLPGFI